MRGVDRWPADDRVGEHRGEGEHDRCAAADQGGPGERADSADGDGACLGLERERLAAGDERGERQAAPRGPWVGRRT